MIFDIDKMRRVSLLYGVNDTIFDMFDIYLTKFIELLPFVDRLCDYLWWWWWSINTFFFDRHFMQYSDIRENVN